LERLCDEILAILPNETVVQTTSSLLPNLTVDMEDTLPNLGQANTIRAQNKQNEPNLAQEQDKK